MRLYVEGYQIYSDGGCTTLTKDMVSKEKGNKYDSLIGYFPNITLALNRMLEENISDSAAKDLNALAAEIKVFTDKVSIPELLKAINQG